jgi:hypothetical protein
MLTWDRIFVFGYGASHIIGPEINGSVSNDLIDSINPLISYLATLQHDDAEINISELHALTILNNETIIFLPKSPKSPSQRFAFKDIDTEYVKALADEIADKATPNDLQNMIPTITHK